MITEAEKKAKELVERLRNEIFKIDIESETPYEVKNWNEVIKQCALICVDEKIKEVQSIPDLKVVGDILLNRLNELYKVKQEINKL